MLSFFFILLALFFSVKMDFPVRHCLSAKSTRSPRSLSSRHFRHYFLFHNFSNSWRLFTQTCLPTFFSWKKITICVRFNRLSMPMSLEIYICSVSLYLLCCFYNACRLLLLLSFALLIILSTQYFVTTIFFLFLHFSPRERDAQCLVISAFLMLNTSWVEQSHQKWPTNDSFILRKYSNR